MEKINPDDYKEMLYRHNPHLTLLSDYSGMKNRVKVIDQEGIVYNSIARTLLVNNHPNIRAAIDKTRAFKEKLKKIQPSLSVVDEYEEGRIKIKVKDKLGIEYSVKPENLLLGRIPCIITATNKTNSFIIKAKLVHGDKYDYSLSRYRNSKKPLQIICKKHGVFKQAPNNHVSQKQGCPDCSSRRGWGKSKWLEYAKNKICIFYIIKCWHQEEQFIKIGITATSIKKRFHSTLMPYKYETIYQQEGTANDIWNLEELYSERYEAFKYIPPIRFRGISECYNISIIKHKGFPEIVK